MLPDRKIAFIGLGLMGAPMAGRLLAAGHELVVYNRSAHKAEPLLAAGAGQAASPREAASGCPVIFTMIADDDALRAVTMGEDGALAGASPGAILVDMSTVSASASRQVAMAAQAKEVAFLRAPVSGSVSMAQSGDLSIMVSGPRQAYESVKELFGAMGNKLYHLGEGEQARFLKLAVNLMLGGTALLAAEALALGRRGGVDWAQMVEVIKSSAIGSPLMNYKAPLLAARDFTAPQFSARLMAKDLGLALAAGKEHEIPMPATALVRQFLGALKATGRGELDFFALVTLLEELAGLPAEIEGPASA